VTPSDVLASIGGAAGIAAAAKAVWSWWTQRDASRLAAAATERAALTAASTSERADLIAELRASRDASDARAAKAQERNEALVAVLHALTSEVAKGNGAVTALSDVVNDHSRREAESFAEIRALLRLSGPPTGEQPRASVVPSPGRAPTPPRGAR
jgi:hypothetical protein